MPAAAVIPAPIAYIKFVAVKKLVVEFQAQGGVNLTVSYFLLCLFNLLDSIPLLGWGEARLFTVNKSECLKQAYA